MPVHGNETEKVGVIVCRNAYMSCGQMYACVFVLVCECVHVCVHAHTLISCVMDSMLMEGYILHLYSLSSFTY